MLKGHNEIKEKKRRKRGKRNRHVINHLSFVHGRVSLFFFFLLDTFVINNVKNCCKWKARIVINFRVCIWLYMYALWCNWNASVKHSRNLVIKPVKTERNNKIKKCGCYTWPALLHLRIHNILHHQLLSTSCNLPKYIHKKMCVQI